MAGRAGQAGVPQGQNHADAPTPQPGADAQQVQRQAEIAGGSSARAEGKRESLRDRNRVFRGDVKYRGGPIGRALGAEADSADIQNFVDHVLRTESNKTSRYTSVTVEVKVALKFAAQKRIFVRKGEMAKLLELESQGIIRIWTPEAVYQELLRSPKRTGKTGSKRAATDD